MTASFASPLLANFTQIFLGYFESYDKINYFTILSIIGMFMISSVIVLTLLDSRFSKRKTYVVICCYLVIMAIVNLLSIFVFFDNIEIFSQLTIVSFALLLLGGGIYISKWTIDKTLFGTLVGISIIAIIMETSMMFRFLFVGRMAMSTAMIILFVVQAIFLIWFLQKVFKPQFIYTFRELPTGWGWYSFVPISQIVIHCLYFLYEIAKIQEFDLRICVNMGMVNVLMLLAYWLIFFNMNKARDADREKMNVKIYQSQVDMLSGQINASREAENSMKIIRHDLKHYIGTLKEFFDNGDIEKAKEYIGYVNGNVEMLAKEIYCENAIINACFGFYLGKARDADIDIKYNLRIPNNATANDVEFSTVIANVVENAINACLKLEKQNRKIKIEIKTEESKILVEIRNSFCGAVEFDENQIPLSKEGVGVTSVLSYAKANLANVQFSVDGGMFIFRMVARR
ncbi:MAG: GHKL domain-containing protein [Bacillota bacterium]